MAVAPPAGKKNCNAMITLSTPAEVAASAFSAAEYIALLGTYSDHIAIDEWIRTEFFGGIENAINRHGGAITVYDTIDLQLARKP